MTTEDEINQLKQRIIFLEGKVASLEHELDKKGIIAPLKYPPYIPWTTPTPVDSMFSPSEFLKVVPHSKDGN